MSTLWSAFDWDRLRAKSETGALALLMNVDHIDAPAFEVAPGVTMRRATEVEAKEFRTCVEFMLGLSLTPNRRNPYETKSEVAPTDGGWTYLHWPIEGPSQRYHVVEVAGGTNHAAHQMAMAGSLSGRDLEVAVHATWGPMVGQGAGVSGTFGSFLETADDDSEFVSFDQADLSELSDLYAKLDSLHRSGGALNLSLMSYRKVRFIPRGLHLRMVGHMAILESLITHQSSPDDIEDSLTRQVTRKMVLLNSRFKHPLEYSECGGATEETIWKKLYDIRSLIVHGVLPDFSKSQLRFLGNLEIVGRQVQAATARVMRYALEEPAHMAEVRACRADQVPTP
jgi:hypothetical protein